MSLTKAIEFYKSCLESIVAQIFMVVNQSIILSTGPFFLLSLPQVSFRLFTLNFFFCALLWGGGRRRKNKNRQVVDEKQFSTCKW